MKVLYSSLKNLIPGLKADAREVGHVLTMNGFMMDGFEEVSYLGKKDHVLNLEVRQNRGDCFGAFGIAYEVAARYGLKVKLPEAEISSEKKIPPVRIDAKQTVRRAVVAGVEGAKSGLSPREIREFVELCGMNSVNMLVDISNYVMLMTGYPNHLFDTAKMTGPLTWGHNKRFSRITTLAGTELELKKQDELLIHDELNPLSTLMVGGRIAEVDEKTTAFLAEVAVYDPSQVQRDSRTYHVVTEASRRLEKDLDPSGAQYALKLLLSLILRHAGGRVSTGIFDYYPNQKKFAAKPVSFDPASPSRFSGTKISEGTCGRILKNLRFTVQKGGSTRSPYKKTIWKVTPPTDRRDIAIPEDVVEEIVRLNGYEKIPAAVVPAFAPVPDITPIALKLEEKIRDILAANGLDEVRLLPMTTEEMNRRTNFEPWKMIKTQNSINEEFPVLRQSILASLIPQAEMYARKNIRHIGIFEIGKVFGRKGNVYREHDACGILIEAPRGARSSVLVAIHTITEKLLRTAGISDISYRKEKANSPALSAGMDVVAQGILIGKVAALKRLKVSGNKFLEQAAYAELNMDALAKIRKGKNIVSVVELLEKLVVLDANVEVSSYENGQSVLEDLSSKIGGENLWSMEVIDAFKLQGGKTRLTVRVSYQNITDADAKKLHDKIFANV
jgi:phenylalanyl-tRNA synthetase beta chain